MAFMSFALAGDASNDEICFFEVRVFTSMKLSLRSMVIAGALFKAIGFLFVSLLNVILRPYGGAYLALLASFYPGYDPTSGLAGVIVGTFYSLLAGAVAGFVFGVLYNFFADRV
jgi:ABC-type phosphate transport system permease subunit